MTENTAVGADIRENAIHEVLLLLGPRADHLGVKVTTAPALPKVISGTREFAGSATKASLIPNSVCPLLRGSLQGR